MGSKSPKPTYFNKLRSFKKRLSKTESDDDSKPPKEESAKPEYVIHITDFKSRYIKFANENFASLKNEYKILINESMAKKEQKYVIFNTIETLCKLDVGVINHIIQVDDVRVTVSKTSFSNAKLDAVYMQSSENANTVEYIVCQNPMEDSVIDFFNLIWDQNIIFTIFLERSSKRKNSIYEFWPDTKGTSEFNSNENTFVVRVKTESTFGNLIERVINIEKNNTELREITQLHLITSQNLDEPILNIYENLFIRMHSIKSNMKCNPILLHSSNSNLDQCSFVICIDKIITKLVNGSKEINIYNTMMEINQYRNLLLQQEKQYLCLYEYIDWFLRKATKIVNMKKNTKQQITNSEIG